MHIQYGVAMNMGYLHSIQKMIISQEKKSWIFHGFSWKNHANEQDYGFHIERSWHDNTCYMACEIRENPCASMHWKKNLACNMVNHGFYMDSYFYMDFHGM